MDQHTPTQSHDTSEDNWEEIRRVVGNKPLDNKAITGALLRIDARVDALKRQVSGMVADEQDAFVNAADHHTKLVTKAEHTTQHIQATLSSLTTQEKLFDVVRAISQCHEAERVVHDHHTTHKNLVHFQKAYNLCTDNAPPTPPTTNSPPPPPSYTQSTIQSLISTQEAFSLIEGIPIETSPQQTSLQDQVRSVVIAAREEAFRVGVQEWSRLCSLKLQSTAKDQTQQQKQTAPPHQQLLGAEGFVWRVVKSRQTKNQLSQPTTENLCSQLLQNPEIKSEMQSQLLCGQKQAPNPLEMSVFVCVVLAIVEGIALQGGVCVVSEEAVECEVGSDHVVELKLSFVSSVERGEERLKQILQAILSVLQFVHKHIFATLIDLDFVWDFVVNAIKQSVIVEVTTAFDSPHTIEIVKNFELKCTAFGICELDNKPHTTLHQLFQSVEKHITAKQSEDLLQTTRSLLEDTNFVEVDSSAAFSGVDSEGVFYFPVCQITQSANKIVQMLLLHSHTALNAPHSHWLQNVVECFQLCVAVGIVRANSANSVARLSMLVHNDCMLFAHCARLITVIIAARKMENEKEEIQSVCSWLIVTAGHLEQLALQIHTTHMTNSWREFEGVCVSLDSQLSKRISHQITTHIRAWEVLPKSLRILSLATVFEKTLSHLCEVVLSMQDIGSDECDVIANNLMQTIQAFTEFIPSEIVAENVPSATAVLKIIELLTTRLAHIPTLWKEGRLHPLTSSHVTHLVMAIFAESANRQAVLRAIG